MMAEPMQELRGKLTENAPLGVQGWFKCGGAAEHLYKPADLQDLQTFLQQQPSGVPVHIFGALSNTIIRDGGVPGMTIRLGRAFGAIEVLEDGMIRAGALALDANVAKTAADHGIAGLEFLSGIPGTIGGAVKMNAGCYGTETKDVLVSCEALDGAGALHILTPADLKMSYRHSELPRGWVVLTATFQGHPAASPDKVRARIREIKEKREASQPIREKTGGSTFANPSVEELRTAGLPDDMKVWQLIDRVGGRGLCIGGAQMSEKHCNFMINTGEATAADLEGLGKEIRRRVLEECGVSLRWEIRRVGEKRPVS